MKHIVRRLKEAASINMRFTGNLFICFLLLLGLSGRQTEPEQQRQVPPDLSGCSRIEILYFPQLEYFLGVSHYRFSQEELDYLNTIEVVVVVDEETIRDSAHDVGQSIYGAPNIPRAGDVV